MKSDSGWGTVWFAGAMVVIGAITGATPFVAALIRQPTVEAAQVSTLLPLMSATMGRVTISNSQMTGIDNTTAQTVTVPSGSREVEIQAEDNNIRWRSDNTAPTASVGNIIFAGDSREFDASLGVIKLISTGADAKANLHFTK